MMQSRGLLVDHTTVYRWVQAYAPEIESRCRPYLSQTNDSWREDETYIKVKGEWKYLHRAVDSSGNTIDFMLSAKRHVHAAVRFFRKALKAEHNRTPRGINVDKNAANPPSIDELKKSALLPDDCQLRQVKYLNNNIEQDHRFIKRLVKPGMGFASFNSARRTLKGYETMNMIRNFQVKGVKKLNYLSAFLGTIASL